MKFDLCIVDLEPKKSTAEKSTRVYKGIVESNGVTENLGKTV